MVLLDLLKKRNVNRKTGTGRTTVPEFLLTQPDTHHFLLLVQGRVRLEVIGVVCSTNGLLNRLIFYRMPITASNLACTDETTRPLENQRIK